jgi:Sel1 repeat
MLSSTHTKQTYGRSENVFKKLQKMIKTITRLNIIISIVTIWFSAMAMAMCEKDFTVWRELNKSGKEREAFDKLISAANLNDLLAQLLVGQSLMEGVGTRVDNIAAAYWMKLAAIGGSPQAQFTYGAMLDTGTGVPPDKSAAFTWYLKAANAGNAFALSNIANMYENGDAVDKNLIKALAYYLSATETEEAGLGEKAKKAAERLKLQLTQEELEKALKEALQIEEKGAAGRESVKVRMATLNQCAF